jgi:hypothetical protein
MADKKKTERPPLKAFLHHQGRAIEETGKALAELLPRGFRDHAEAALDESKQGFGALFDGVIDTVDEGLDRLRRKPKGKPGKDKVKVEVE